MAAHRNNGYLRKRHELEELARNIFISKGGRPLRKAPHYMVVGECEWLKTWYTEGDCVKIHISEFKLDTVSFTYGDLFPTFSPRVNDNKEYRKNVYTYSEIIEIINRYGLPQEWNRDGKFGPERYVEVQVWDDEPIKRQLELI